MRLIVLLLSTVLLLGSCVIEINGNGYKTISPNEKKKLKQFSIDSTDVVKNPKANLELVEISADDVKKVLNKYSYAWILIWKPWCHGQHCYPLYYYEKIDRTYRDKGLKFLPVSEVYQEKDIKDHLEKAGFDRDLYVLKDADYGHKIDKSKKRFLFDITGDETIVKHLPAHLIYKGNKLIYYGENISDKIMDSVLHLN